MSLFQKTVFKEFVASQNQEAIKTAFEGGVAESMVLKQSQNLCTQRLTQNA